MECAVIVSCRCVGDSRRFMIERMEGEGGEENFASLVGMLSRTYDFIEVDPTMGSEVARAAPF